MSLKIISGPHTPPLPPILRVDGHEDAQFQCRIPGYQVPRGRGQEDKLWALIIVAQPQLAKVCGDVAVKLDLGPTNSRVNAVALIHLSNQGGGVVPVPPPLLPSAPTEAFLMIHEFIHSRSTLMAFAWHLQDLISQTVNSINHAEGLRPPPGTSDDGNGIQYGARCDQYQ